MKLVNDLILDENGSMIVIKAGTTITEASKAAKEYRSKMRGKSDIDIASDEIEDVDKFDEMINRAVENSELVNIKHEPSDGDSYVAFDIIEMIIPLGFPVNSKEDKSNLLEAVQDWYWNDGDKKLKDAAESVSGIYEKYMTVEEVMLVSKISGLYDIKVTVLNHDIDTDYTPNPEDTLGVKDIHYKKIGYEQRPRGLKKTKGSRHKNYSDKNRILKMQAAKRGRSY